MKNRIIMLLLNIPKVSRKTILYLIKTNHNYFNNVSEFNSKAIREIFINSKVSNGRIKIPNIEDIESADDKALAIIKDLQHLNINILSILDYDFPIRLKEIKDPPVLLYYIGNKECIINSKSIAIVGSRKATQHGLKIAERLAKIFTQDDYIIVSGLAVGIDEVAHKGCIDANGKTVAILPGGIDKIYPAYNKILAEEIIKNGGCIISEYGLGVKPFKNYFIERDRLQSGLSNAVMVIETKINGGTMHTARFALEDNRILACYSNLDNYKTLDDIQGNIKLINEDGALAIRNTNDICNLKKIIEENVFKIDRQQNNDEYTEQTKFNI